MRALRDLVIEGARRAPDAVAVIDECGSTSYAELDALANRAAHALAERGVGPGDRVGIWLDKSAEAVAAMQGVLRLGAAYVPLDPKNPRARVARIALGCGLAAVVTTPARGVELARDELAELRIVEPAQMALAGDEPICLGQRREADLAYILYTSGSTGEPKGVCISERNALAFVEWAAAELCAEPRDVFSNHAPFHFDLSVLDLYVAFLAGAAVRIVPDGIAYAPARLARFLQSEGITVWYSVPSALMMMMDQGELLATATPRLRAVCFAGEPFPIKHLRALVDSRPGVRFLNLYGPTETNVCTFHEVRELSGERTIPVPIGVACSGDRVWAADEAGRPVAQGEEGELWVEGDTVMLGYWGQPAHQGPYRTGDRVRQNPDGSFDYLGRRDHMVKVRGHRIELGEIEAAVLAHADVREAAVVVRGRGMEARICAWLVAREGANPGLLSIKRHCAALLPRYMIVDEVRLAAALPRTRNGKIDRRELLLAPTS